MGVSLAIYRMRFGCFVMPRRSGSAVKTLTVSRVIVSTTVRAVLFLSMLAILGGDVEVNPGPPKSQKQQTLSFADVSVTEASSPQLSAQASNSPIYTRSTRKVHSQNENVELMKLLRDMKTELKSDLLSLNVKMDELSSSV